MTPGMRLRKDARPHSFAPAPFSAWRWDKDLILETTSTDADLHSSSRSRRARLLNGQAFASSFNLLPNITDSGLDSAAMLRL